MAFIAAALIAGCVDGVTPDCAASFNTCGPLDASPPLMLDAADEASDEAGNTRSDGGAPRDAQADG